MEQWVQMVRMHPWLCLTILPSGSKLEVEEVAVIPSMVLQITNTVMEVLLTVVLVDIGTTHPMRIIAIPAAMAGLAEAAAAAYLGSAS